MVQFCYKSLYKCTKAIKECYKKSERMRKF